MQNQKYDYERLFKIIENEGWEIIEQPYERDIILSKPTSRVPTINIKIKEVKNIQKIVDTILNETRKFNVEEYVTNWTKEKIAGALGVPNIRELLKDAEEIEKTLTSLANAVKDFVPTSARTIVIRQTEINNWAGLRWLLLSSQSLENRRRVEVMDNLKAKVDCYEELFNIALGFIADNETVFMGDLCNAVDGLIEKYKSLEKNIILTRETKIIETTEINHWQGLKNFLSTRKDFNASRIRLIAGLRGDDSCYKELFDLLKGFNGRDEDFFTQNLNLMINKLIEKYQLLNDNLYINGAKVVGNKFAYGNNDRRFYILEDELMASASGLFSILPIMLLEDTYKKEPYKQGVKNWKTTKVYSVRYGKTIFTHDAPEEKKPYAQKVALTSVITEKAFIHIATEKQDRALRSELHKRGKKWRNGDSYLKYSSLHFFTNKEMVMRPYYDSTSTVDSAKSRAPEVKIYEFDEVDLTK